MKEVGARHYLTSRKGVWYYRRRVPENLIDAIGRAYWQESLQTRDLKEAQRRRTVKDLEVDALIVSLESAASNPGASASPFLTTDALVSHLRAHVEDRHRQFLQRSETEALSPAEQQEARRSVEEEIAVLKNPQDPRHDEWIGQVGDKVLQALGRPLGQPDLNPNAFDKYIERALLEFSRRKLAAYRHDYGASVFDALFDPSTKPETTFGDLCADYLAAKQEEASLNGTSQKRIDKVIAHVALVREIIGEATAVSSINYDACARLRSLLAQTPSNRTKLYPGVSVENAAVKASAAGKPLLSPTTQNQYMDTFRDILQLAVRKELLGANPAQGMKALKKDHLSDNEKRRPWSLDQISAFFTSPFYKSCAPGAATPYDKNDRAWRFWLPLICLFMGMRPNEVCQLHAADLKRTPSGTWYFDLVPSTDVAGVKTLKTATSRRRIPIHPELERIGLIAFVQERQLVDLSVYLFDGLKADKYGNRAAYPLRRFRETFLPEAVTLGERQEFYSLRHSFRDALRRCNAPPDALQALGGWSQGKLVSDSYGDGLDPDYQRQWIAKVAYPGLDLSFLHTPQD